MGGYEVGAWRLLRTLEKRHNIQSHELVSARGSNQVAPGSEPRVYRLLPLPGAMLSNGKWVAHRNANQTRIDRLEATKTVLEIVDQVRPEVVLFWQYFGDGGYSVDVLNHLAQRNVPVFCYASNMQLPLHRLVPLSDILQNASVPLWQSLARAARFWWQRARNRWDGASASLDWGNVAFCSEYLKNRHIQLGYPAHPGKVIHWGIDQVSDKQVIQSRSTPAMPLRLIWAGRICAPKGLHVPSGFVAVSA